MFRSILENDEQCLTGKRELIAHQRIKAKLARVQHTQMWWLLGGCSSCLAFLVTGCCHRVELNGFKQRHSKSSEKSSVLIKCIATMPAQEMLNLQMVGS